MKRIGNALFSLAAAALLLGAAPAAQAANVAVFDNGGYVDTTGNAGAESDQVQAALTALGHNVSPFTGIAAADFAAALAGADVLLIPELELGNLAAALTPAAIAVIRSYVEGGGGLVIHGSFFSTAQPRAANLLNAVFGFSLSEGSVGVGSTLNAAAAAGTTFEGGPATLPFVSGMSVLATAGLPAGSRSIYANGANSEVALLPAGFGKIAYLGWDWFNPADQNEGGWTVVLARAVEEVGAPDPAELIAQLRQAIVDLVEDGVRLPANGQSLFAKLNAALAALEAGDVEGAIDSLTAFKNQVAALVQARRLTAAQGQTLIDAADAIIALL